MQLTPMKAVWSGGTDLGADAIRREKHIVFNLLTNEKRGPRPGRKRGGNIAHGVKGLVDRPNDTGFVRVPRGIAAAVTNVWGQTQRV
jgi:hypothetical protein